MTLEHHLHVHKRCVLPAATPPPLPPLPYSAVLSCSARLFQYLFTEWIHADHSSQTMISPG